MNMKITSLIAALVLVMGVGTAQAAEQLTAAQMDSVTAAGSGKHHHKRVLNVAIADAVAVCSGKKCFTDAFTYTEVSKFGSFSSASSTSVYGGGH